MKYFKPNSMTWWAAFIPLVFGLTLSAAEVMPVLNSVVAVINAMTGGVEPFTLIEIGLGGIGLRASPGIALP